MAPIKNVPFIGDILICCLRCGAKLITHRLANVALQKKRIKERIIPVFFFLNQNGWRKEKKIHGSLLREKIICSLFILFYLLGHQPCSINHFDWLFYLLTSKVFCLQIEWKICGINLLMLKTASFIVSLLLLKIGNPIQYTCVINT